MVEGSTQKLYRNPKKKQKKERTELQSFLDRHDKNKSYTQGPEKKKAATSCCYCNLSVCLSASGL
jgi:hypothetical protein